VRRKVSVVGTSGSGKTTLAAALAARLGVPHVELDALHHGPNWTEASAEELRERVGASLAGLDGWIVDGNYHGKIGGLVLWQSDTVVWLDLPLRVCLARLWRRTSTRIRDDVELWNGNREDWSNVLLGWDSLFVWTLRSHVRRRLTWPDRFARLDHVELVRLRSETEVARWLATQGPPARLAPPGASVAKEPSARPVDST
jgi:adenylate kinase family enzyme